MSSWARAAILLLPMLFMPSSTMAMPEGVAALGRPATDNEVVAWDIDVRPDFAGLPPGTCVVTRVELAPFDVCVRKFQIRVGPEEDRILCVCTKAVALIICLYQMSIHCL